MKGHRTGAGPAEALSVSRGESGEGYLQSSLFMLSYPCTHLPQ